MKKYTINIVHIYTVYIIHKMKKYTLSSDVKQLYAKIYMCTLPKKQTKKKTPFLAKVDV